MSRKMTDELDAALEHGVDVKGRRIFLHGGVDEDSIGMAIRAMYLMADMTNGPITLFVCSYGGELDEAFALHDVTRTIKVPVHTVALGKCMSAAPLLVACGEPGERWASEHTQFMLHDCSLEVDEGSPAFIAAHVAAARAQMVRYAELLAEYTTKKKTHWANMFKMRADKFFSAEEARDWGLIDNIWSEKDGEA